MKPNILKITEASDKNSQFHGNYCLHAELDNGSKIYYHNVKFQIPTLHVRYPNGKVKTFSEDFNSLPKNRNFGNTKYSEVVKQIYQYFELKY